MKPIKRRRRQDHAKLYKALNLPKSWIAVLREYPDPLKVLPIMMTALSISIAEETCDALEDLTDALTEKYGSDETEELIRLQ